MNQFQNGRVITTNQNLKDLKMIENNKTLNNFQSEALYGIQETTELNQLFFSKQNMKIIQDKIRYEVYLKTEKKHIIDNQSDVELEIVMRSTYLQHSPNLPNKTQEQIKYLNQLVTNWCVEKIIPEIYQYFGYLKEVEYMPVPLEHPVNLSSKGTKNLKSVTTTF
tara:strand:+ start:2081 stop:2575 length:495 start_codon:yes stop_codon:yes gene_type:complete